MKSLKFFSIAFVMSMFVGMGVFEAKGMSNVIPIRTTPDHIKLSFAPPWWMNDYPQFMNKNGRHFSQLKKYGYNTIKLWQAHIQPGFYIPFHAGTFGFKCDLSQISMGVRASCPYYFQAIDALRASNMNVSIEMHPVNPRDLYGKDNCRLNGRADAVKFGKEAAAHAWKWAYRPYLLAGGRLDALIFDGPIDKMMQQGNASFGCGFSRLSDALTATVEFMKWMQDRFELAKQSRNFTDGKVEFVYLVNFPHWKFGSVGSSSSSNHNRKGDFQTVIDHMARASKQYNLNLVGFEFDNPLNYTIDLRQEECNFLGFNCKKPPSYTMREINKLRQAQQKVKQHGLEFRMIAITDTKHIDEGDMPVRYDPTESQIFTHETTFFADLLRMQYGDYLHNITLQSWLNAPSYIFNRSGPKEHGMLYNALQIGRRAKGGFCSLQQFEQETERKFSGLADAISYYNDRTNFDKIICMPSYTQNGAAPKICSTYYYLLKKPFVVDYTIDALTHYDDNGSSDCVPLRENSWLRQFEYKDRHTRIFTKGF